jgi:hypothetical protein
MDTINKLPDRIIIPGIMETLREIRDRLSAEHVSMTAKEELDYYERHRKEFSLWPEGTKFANSKG